MKISGTHNIFILPELALLPERLLLLILILGLYDGVGSCLCTQILDYWRNQTSLPTLLIQYVLILVWLCGDINVLGLYKLCCSLCVSLL